MFYQSIVLCGKQGFFQKTKKRHTLKFWQKINYGGLAIHGMYIDVFFEHEKYKNILQILLEILCLFIYYITLIFREKIHIPTLRI